MADGREKKLGHPRTVLWVCALVAVFVLIYVTVVGLYARTGEVDVSGEGSAIVPGAVQLVVTPEEVDAEGDRLEMGVELVDGGDLSSDGFALDQPLSVIVTQTDGPRILEFSDDDLLGRQTVRLLTEGFVEQWPFDTYSVTSMIVPVNLTDGDAEPVPYSLGIAGSVPGWTIDAVGETVNKVESDAGISRVQLVTFTASRSASTIAFGIVLLGLMVLVPVLTLTAAITVWRGRRKVEATMMSWLGAMLFATIPLRNFLPGSPPIGSWIDYLVVLWVIAGLVASLAIFVSAWLKSGPPGSAPFARDRDPTP